jgi:putative transcriptional regulator
MGKRLMNGVRDCREMKELTQDNLAQAVGVSRQTIIAIERGNYTPSVALAMELAKVLGCPVEKLFFWK